MQMQHEVEVLPIDGLSVVDAISALQAWSKNHPDISNDSISFSYDVDYFTFAEVYYQRPMTEKELVAHDEIIARTTLKCEERELAEYNRLKAKFEGI